MCSVLDLFVARGAAATLLVRFRPILKILPQARQGSYFFNRIGQKAPFRCVCDTRYAVSINLSFS
jgi:hypothetical protein